MPRTWGPACLISNWTCRADRFMVEGSAIENRDPHQHSGDQVVWIKHMDNYTNYFIRKRIPCTNLVGR